MMDNLDQVVISNGYEVFVVGIETKIDGLVYTTTLLVTPANFIKTGAFEVTETQFFVGNGADNGCEMVAG